MNLRRRIAPTVAAITLAATGTLALAAPAADAEPNLVAMDEITVPIVDGARLDGALTVKLVLGTSDAESADRVAAALPLLRSTSVAAALEFSRLYASPMAPVDAERLSNDLSRALRQAEPAISRVLIVEVAARAA